MTAQTPSVVVQRNAEPGRDADALAFPSYTVYRWTCRVGGSRETGTPGADMAASTMNPAAAVGGVRQPAALQA
jgi:hypothetical protein